MADEGIQSRKRWIRWGPRPSSRDEESASNDQEKSSRPRWNMGMLNDKETIEVPGSVLLLASDHNEPLGLRNAPARTSHSSIPTGIPFEAPAPAPAHQPEDDKKKTKDGQIILDPQPDDSSNDPLNWAAWRRDSALLSLGLYCMIGGGITPLIAAGFTNVAHDYHISTARVSLTTGLYMMGLGIGSVIFSPTAILWGKRPVYLFSAIIFILASVWCALSPSFTSLILARIFQGIAVSPVECLPSATIAEIFFLHERAYRIGIYTLLLLGGKNLIPLVSAAIIQSLSWRWVFWMVAIVVGFSGMLLFFFVPETFWDRSPHPKPHNKSKRPSLFSRRSSAAHIPRLSHHRDRESAVARAGDATTQPTTPASPHRHHHRDKHIHVGFASHPKAQSGTDANVQAADSSATENHMSPESKSQAPRGETSSAPTTPGAPSRPNLASRATNSSALSPRTTGVTTSSVPQTPELRNLDSTVSGSYFPGADEESGLGVQPIRSDQDFVRPDTDSDHTSVSSKVPAQTGGQAYTHALRQAPPKTFAQQLQIYNGRLNHDKWWRVALRPFFLFAYPSVLWSAAVYSCSIGWLIVISESVSIMFRTGYYHFSALTTGLLYISPFVGGILGTAVAGKVSDIIVKAMARRNGGLYEPEFRLVMAIPIVISTVIGLMGFGWSAGQDDPWIVPTVFFGIVSFGCSLGSTTAITFCVDSYRQYAGEALVTLNFSKNIFHGLVFSLFVTDWLTADGSKTVYIWIGVIQLILLLFTIPMYIYGKRARMWTVRRNLMEKF